MNILVVNAGSSSLKFQVLDAKKCLLSGTIEEIGGPSKIHYTSKSKKRAYNKTINDHEEAIHEMTDILLLCDVHDVEAVGHRVVHGGMLFSKPTKISSGILQRLEQLSHLAPLHNPANVTGIRESMKLFDHVPHIAVFDTAFHATMPESAHIIPIPEEFKHGGLIRKYGFHGTSHQYAYSQLSKYSKKKGRVICAHIGNGQSVTAILDGKSVNNSMGFTPLPGPIMGTRTGDIDFGVATFLHEHNGFSMEELDMLFNHEGGLYGICGRSDIREIYEHRKEPRCHVALDTMYVDLARIICSYTVDLGGFDSLIFTASAGSGAPWLRAEICSRLGHLGVVLDDKLNTANKEGKISAPSSAVDVLVIAADEEKMIADLVRGCLK